MHVIIIRPYGKQFTPMGMDKSGSQTIVEGAWTALTGWVARSGYSSTVITSNGLELPLATGLVTAKVTYGNNTFGSTKQIRLTLDGAVVWTSSSSNFTNNITGSTTLALGGGILKLEAYENGGTSSNRNISAGSTNTYVYIDAS